MLKLYIHICVKGIFMSEIKVVTICGSMRFKKEMLKVAEELEIKKGYAVIQCVFVDDMNCYSASDFEKMGAIHLKKIEISDAIYVVNVDGYIGSSVKKEIEYAKKLGKEILSLEPLHIP